MKPIIVEDVPDEHEEKAGIAFEQFMEKNGDPELLIKASKEFSLSDNPEGKKMASLCMALYFRSKGIHEKNDSYAQTWLKKALKEFRKIDPKERTVKEIELELLKRTLNGLKKRHDRGKEAEVFLRRAALLKELGNERSYHQEMSLHYMIKMFEYIDTKPEADILATAQDMVSHAEKANHKDLLEKTKSLFYQIKAKHAFTTKEALKEYQLAIDAIRNTSDKFGQDIVETEYLMTKALQTSDINERQKLLQKVAKAYHDQGLTQKEDFVKRLLSPIPLKGGAVIMMADNTNEKLTELEKKISSTIGHQSGPSAIFYHLSYMRERIRDVRRIVSRMVLTKKQLTDLHIRANALRPAKETPGKPYPKRLNDVLNKINDLTDQMRQDMESFFIYGNLLLDQWSYIIGYLSGHKVPVRAGLSPKYQYEEFRSLFTQQSTKDELSRFWNTHKSELPPVETEFNFIGLISLLQARNYNGELRGFWDTHKRDIIWLNFHLRFFRNVFIEHLRKPWQRSNTMGVYTEEFKLFIPAAGGYIKPEEEKKILEAIYPLAPQRLRDMPDDYWEKKNLRRVLEVTLFFIDELDKQQDRDQVWAAWHKLGGSTASYDVISSRLFGFLIASLDTMIKFIDDNPELIELGKF